MSSSLYHWLSFYLSVTWKLKKKEKRTGRWYALLIGFRPSRQSFRDGLLGICDKNKGDGCSLVYFLEFCAATLAKPSSEDRVQSTRQFFLPTSDCFPACFIHTEPEIYKFHWEKPLSPNLKQLKWRIIYKQNLTIKRKDVLHGKRKSDWFKVTGLFIDSSINHWSIQSILGENSSLWSLEWIIVIKKPTR